MNQEMDVLRIQLTPEASRRVFPVISGRLRTRCHQLRPGIMACGLYFAVISALAANPPTTAISLLSEFRPIGGSGNNLEKPDFNVVPGSPELALAPLNFAPGTKDG